MMNDISKKVPKSPGNAGSAIGAKFEEEVERLRPVGIRETEADRAAVDAFAAGDPFAKAGLFSATEIRRWRKVFFNPPAE